MTDTSTAVTAGVQAYADAEAGLRAAHDALLKLPATYRAVFAANPTPVGAAAAATPSSQPQMYQAEAFGYLESERRCANAVAFSGKIAELLQQLLWQHSDDTQRAKSLGIDLPLPGTVHPDGGGR